MRVRTRTGGFTLLEILLSLMIIGLLAGVLVVGAVRLTEPKAVTPEDIFWKAVLETRKRALLGSTEVRLRITGKNKSLALVASGGGGSDVTFPFNSPTDISVDFLSTQKSASAILIGGQLVETQTVPYVTFFGDGTCTPFRIQLHAGGPARLISIDPWTCAAMLPMDDNRR